MNFDNFSYGSNKVRKPSLPTEEGIWGGSGLSSASPPPPPHWNNNAAFYSGTTSNRVAIGSPLSSTTNHFLPLHERRRDEVLEITTTASLEENLIEKQKQLFLEKLTRLSPYKLQQLEEQKKYTWRYLCKPIALERLQQPLFLITPCVRYVVLVLGCKDINEVQLYQKLYYMIVMAPDDETHLIGHTFDNMTLLLSSTLCYKSHKLSRSLLVPQLKIQDATTQGELIETQVPFHFLTQKYNGPGFVPSSEKLLEVLMEKTARSKLLLKKHKSKKRNNPAAMRSTFSTSSKVSSVVGVIDNGGGEEQEEPKKKKPRRDTVVSKKRHNGSQKDKTDNQQKKPRNLPRKRKYKEVSD